MLEQELRFQSNESPNSVNPTKRVALTSETHPTPFNAGESIFQIEER